jgi:hypothetical protein
MKKSGVTGLALAMLALGCEQTTEPVAEALAPGVQMARDVQELSPRDQAVVDAFNNGAPWGAVINNDVSCSVLTGFFDASGLVAFGGLFANECTGGTFERTNPDGTADWHAHGRGEFFLVIFAGGFFPSAGSSVKWQIIGHEDGISVWSANGTLSDGSRVRAHFVTDPNGDNKPANALWVEGLGYVLGGPPGRGR